MADKRKAKDNGLLVEVMQRYYWLAVEADEYELPLAVADTAKELGDIFGISKSVVIDAVNDNRSGRICGRKFVKVERNE